MFAYKINMLFVQPHHFRGQKKNSLVIYFFMGKKAPAISVD
jgi:hypothetical protein